MTENSFNKEVTLGTLSQKTQMICIDGCAILVLVKILDFAKSTQLLEETEEWINMRWKIP
jgi:hypothetical protein